MEKYSAEALEARVRENQYTYLLHHDCALCGEWVMFRFGDDGVWFDSSCGCAWSSPRPASYWEVAYWLTMQSSDTIRDTILERFGPTNQQS